MCKIHHARSEVGLRRDHQGTDGCGKCECHEPLGLDIHTLEESPKQPRLHSMAFVTDSEQPFRAVKKSRHRINNEEGCMALDDPGGFQTAWVRVDKGPNSAETIIW